MVTNTLTAAEAGLRKRLDLSGAHITRTDKALVILVSKKHGGRTIERCLTLHHDQAWEITGLPAVNGRAHLLSSKTKNRGRSIFLARDLPRIAAALGEAQTGGKAK
jgi:hypothetical protein